MAYEKDYKITLDLLSVELRNRLDAIATQESNNEEQASHNKSSLATIVSYVSNRNLLLNTLTSSVNAKANHSKSKATGGYVRDTNTIGINYAYSIGLSGQLLKADHRYRNKMIPHDGMLTMRLCNIENQASVLAVTALDSNDKYAYNYELQRVYYKIQNTGNWVYYDPIDKSRLIFLYHTLVLDPVTKKMWYFISPTKRIYLWTSDTIGGKVSNTTNVPRNQTGAEVIPLDVGRTNAAIETTTTTVDTTNLIGLSANAAIRLDKEFKERVLVGSCYYSDDGYLTTNNPYRIKFKSPSNGPASLILKLSWRLLEDPHPNINKIVTIFNEIGKWSAKSKGTIEISLDNTPSDTIEGNLDSIQVDKDFKVWTETYTFNIESLEKGEHYIGIYLKSDQYNHLYINNITLTLSHTS